MIRKKIFSVLNNKKGSSSILSCLLLTALIIMVSVLVGASKRAAGESYADAAFQLAGRSILSEYDNRLFNDYGIIAFKGDESQIEKDISFYANGSLNSNNLIYSFYRPTFETTSFFKINFTVDANLKEYSIISADIFEEQIEHAMLKKFPQILSSEISGKNSVVKNLKDGDSPYNRTLKNEGAIEALPSYEYGYSRFLPNFEGLNIPSIDELKSSTSSKFLLSEYVLRFFSSANDGMYPEDRFFDNEVEYILSGKMNDEKNYKSVWWTLHTLRLISNNISLAMDNEKRNLINVYAMPFALLGGAGEKGAVVVITELWALAETLNDLKILEDGGNVPFVKMKNQWATNNIAEIIDAYFDDSAFPVDNTIYPVDRSGQDYQDYLRLLLYFSHKEETIFRVMDLIQINMKTSYNKDFLIKDYYAGFRFDVIANGKEFSYLEKY